MIVFEKEVNIGGFALPFRLAVRFAGFEVEAVLRNTDEVVGPLCWTWLWDAEVSVGTLVELTTVDGEDILQTQ